MKLTAELALDQVKRNKKLSGPRAGRIFGSIYDDTPDPGIVPGNADHLYVGNGYFKYL